jgi:hypothetical protein
VAEHKLGTRKLEDHAHSKALVWNIEVPLDRAKTEQTRDAAAASARMFFQVFILDRIVRRLLPPRHVAQS